MSKIKPKMHAFVVETIVRRIKFKTTFKLCGNVEPFLLPSGLAISCQSFQIMKLIGPTSVHEEVYMETMNPNFRNF